MKKIFSTILLISSTLIFSQNAMPGNYTTEKMLQDVWFRTVFEVKIEDVQGTPYYTKEFVPAKVSSLEEKVSARYNIYHDNMEFIKEGKIMVIPKIESYNEILLISYNLKFKLINEGYFLSIYDSPKYQILKKLKVKFQKFVPAKSGYDSDKPAKFIASPAIYYITIGDKLQEIPKSTKKFAEFFPDKQEMISKFMKENKTKLDSDESLRALMKFIEKN